jgi:hypothetical protein
MEEVTAERLSTAQLSAGEDKLQTRASHSRIYKFREEGTEKAATHIRVNIQLEAWKPGRIRNFGQVRAQLDRLA